MKYNLSPSLVLVKVDLPKDKDDDGFFIQEEWQSQPPTGVVEQVSKNVTFCKKGDRVFFERYTSISTPWGSDLRLCREDAILATYEE